MFFIKVKKTFLCFYLQINVLSSMRRTERPLPTDQNMGYSGLLYASVTKLTIYKCTTETRQNVECNAGHWSADMYIS